MQASKREIKLNIASFDLLKGVMILTVFIAHLYQGVSFEKNPELAYGFDFIAQSSLGMMPAFMMISGYHFKKKVPLKMLRSTFSSLCMPCIWVTVITVLATPFTSYFILHHSWERIRYDTISRLLSYLLGIPGMQRDMYIRGYVIYSCGPIWFFWALFIAQNVMNQILWRLKETWTQLLAVLLCAAAGWGLFSQNFVFYSIPQGLMVVGFCYAGYLLKRHQVIQRCIYDIRTYLILVPIALAEFIWGYCDIWSLYFTNVVLDYIGVGCTAFLLMLLGILLGQYEWKATDAIKEMGVYTLWFLAVNCVEMYVIPWFAFEPLFMGRSELYLILMFVVRLIIILLGVMMIKKISKYRYMRRMLKKKRAAG